MGIEQAFEETLAYYDDWMRKALPTYDAMFETAVRVIPYPPDMPIQVLDLGAGTGLFSRWVLDRFPRASLVLVDLGEKMLQAAKLRFREQSGRVRMLVKDMRELSCEACYDVVISGLAIHHLEDADKRALFAAIHKALRPGGAFVNVDQVRGPTGDLASLYWSEWLQMVREREPDEARVQASIERRKTYDRDATMTEQMAWLEAAGFEHVDCVYRHTFVAVFLGIKAEG